MKQALAEKDAIISAHRVLVVQLHRHISGINENVQRMRQIIAALKDSLVKHNIRLPEIRDKVSDTAHTPPK